MEKDLVVIRQRMLSEIGSTDAVLYDDICALEKQIGNNNQILLEYWEELPPVFISSAVKGTGKEEILSYIETFI